MKRGKIAGIATILVGSEVGLGLLRDHLQDFPLLEHMPQEVIVGLMMLLMMLGGAIIAWLEVKEHHTKKGGEGGEGGGAAEAEAPEAADIDELIEEAEARLEEAARLEKARLSRLPAIMVLGETGSAKTTTLVHCGIEAELLAGQMYEENHIAPTPAANFWFARGCVFAEIGGKLLGDAESFRSVIKRLMPGKGAALLGTAREAPRAALVCVDAETLLFPSPDPLAATARKIRAQLADMSQTLGIQLPVYVLFTRTDRIPFFTEYVSKLNDEEAVRILGATLPVIEGHRGVYAEQESARLNAAFEGIFHGLANARPAFLARETEGAQLSAVYEFPREFRKIRPALVRFLVELGKPSQLDAGPFLRGFYFSGVRPVMVNEVAPAVQQQEERRAAGVGATGMFRAKSALAAGPAPQHIIGTRKVPQWVFLGHLFNNLLLADQAAKDASASSVRASVPRRILLIAASVLCLAYSTALLVSYFHNKSLETRVLAASRGIGAVDAGAAATAAPPLDSLQRLETLRQALDTLVLYNRNGAPWSYRWGLYEGDALYPGVRKLYFANFRKLLLLPAQNTIVASLDNLPATPGPEYGPTYDSLKAYLITTSNPEHSTRAFLTPVLLDRWSAARNVDAARMQLAQKQFDFYAGELPSENPFSSNNDAAAIGSARKYLSQFAALERVYQAMLADAAKAGAPVNFNRKFPGSSEVVIDGQDVPAAFTKGGWNFMKKALKNPEKYFAGEPWVLGNQATTNVERSQLAQQLTDRYNSDFIKAWRAYLKAASVVKYASLPDAAKKLGVLSGNQSPLLALFWLASQNTAVDGPEVSGALQPVQAVVPPSSVDRYIAPPNQSYMNAMVTLQASVETAASQTPPSDAAASATLNNATAAKVAARQVAQAFRIDPQAHIEGTVEKLLEDPITNVEALLRNLGPAELNGKGKGFCAVYRAVLNKYPFNPAATPQATVADVNGVFRKPDGALWKFYGESLQKLLPRQGLQYVAVSAGGVTLNPAFVGFFNRAAAFSDFLYAGGTPDPHFSYTLTPMPADGIQTVGLHLDGQAFEYSGGTAAPKKFVWQPSGTHEAKATVKFGNGPDLAWSNSEGLWAIFQFFHKAETWRPAGTANVLEWVIRIGKDPVTLPGGKPLTVRFQLDMAGAPQIFQKGFFSALGCVSEVAK